MRRYGEAWTARDPDAAAELFGEDAIYAWGPFDELRGRAAIRERWAAATADQRDVRFSAEPIAEGDGLVVARWRCRFAIEGADRGVELDGVFVLRFEAGGLCCELREWWAERPAAG